MTASPRHVLLVGLPGSGKSTVAQGVARRLACDVVELDAEVERIAGLPIPDIFAGIGEAGFRRFEAEGTRLLLQRNSPAVVSVGAGWIDNARARALVPQDWHIIYLRVSSSTAAARIAAELAEASGTQDGGQAWMGKEGGGGARPLLAGARSPEELAARLERLAAVRVPLYEQAAATIEDVESATVDAVIARVAAVVSELWAADSAAHDSGR